MLILADKRENLAELCGQRAAEAQLAADLSEADQNLLDMLGTGRPFFVFFDKGLSAVSPWSRVVIIDEAPTSQYDALLTAVRQGVTLPSPTACLALTGTKFHGQKDRPWQALRGNLHLTIYVKLDVPAAHNQIGFTILPALAAIDAVSTLAKGEFGLGIKWINDIMIKDHKIGGVLTSTQIQGGKIKGAIFGIGLNIAQAPQIDPSPFVSGTDYLQRHVQIKLRELFWQLLVSFTKRSDELFSQGPEPLLCDYRRYSLTLGRTVCIWDEDSPENIASGLPGYPLGCGTLSAIGDDLSLKIGEKVLNRGRLSLVRICERENFLCPHRCA